MIRRFAALSLIAAALALGGCRAIIGSCHDPQPYEQAQTAEPLEIPPGLKAPDTRNALAIPELKTPAPPPRKPGDACLDMPPKYAVETPAVPEA
jgi:uncharacterized lipoprotein